MGARGEGVQFKLSMVPVLRPRFLTRWGVPRQWSTLHESVGTLESHPKLGPLNVSVPITTDISVMIPWSISWAMAKDL